LKIVAERLRAARQAKKLSQLEVMSLTGIHNKTLSGYENDVSDPDLETLTKLATLALHRTDNPEDNLPEEALKQLEDYIGLLRLKYKKSRTDFFSLLYYWNTISE